MQNEVMIYRSDVDTSLEVRLLSDTVGLTQKQMTDLYQVKLPAISKQISNIFKDGLLKKDSVISILEITAADGKTYKTEFYTLEMIIAVGMRLNPKHSERVLAFQQWAIGILKERLTAGYVIRSGQRFIEDNNARGSGNFSREVESLYGLPIAYVRQRMRLAELFSPDDPALKNFEVPALLALTKRSVPMEAIEKAKERALAGEWMNSSLVNSIIKQTRQAAMTANEKVRQAKMRILRKQLNNLADRLEVDELDSIRIVVVNEVIV